MSSTILYLKTNNKCRFKQLIDISNEYIKNNNNQLSIELKNYLHSLHLQLTNQQLKKYANEFVSLIDDMQKEETNLWKLIGTISYNEVISWALPFIFKMDPDANNPTIYRASIYPGTVTLYDIDVYFEDDFQDNPEKLKYIQNYKSTYNRYLHNIFEYIFGKNHRFNISYIFEVEQQIMQSAECKLPRNEKEKKRNTYSWCEKNRRYTLDVPVEKKPAKKPAKKKAVK